MPTHFPHNAPRPGDLAAPSWRGTVQWIATACGIGFAVVAVIDGLLAVTADVEGSLSAVAVYAVVGGAGCVASWHPTAARVHLLVAGVVCLGLGLDGAGAVPLVARLGMITAAVGAETR